MNPFDIMLWSVTTVVVLICLLFAVAIIKGIVNVFTGDSGRAEKRKGFRQMRD